MATETIQINIVGNAKGLSEALKKSGAQLNEFGEKLGGLGTRLSGFLTLPVLAIGRWVMANEELKASLAPIGAEFTRIRDELATALLPVIQELMPSILELVRGLGQLVTWFGSLDTATKKTILTWVGLVAAIGPTLMIVGQVIQTIGIAQTVFGGLAAAMPAATAALTAFGTTAVAVLGPIAAVAAAITALFYLFNMPEFKMLLVLASGGLGDLIGGKDYGNRVRLNTAQTLGLPGFANGGAFTVGGSGGTDSTPVSFMATPGERVTVTPPGRGGGLTVVIQAENVMGDNLDRVIIAPLEKYLRGKGVV